MALKIENKNRRTLIHRAIDKKDLEELTKLLDKDPDKPGYEHVDISGGKYGETPLLYAVYKSGGWPEGVRLLIERGADVNSALGMQRTPLQVAAEFNREEIADDLIANGADATLGSVHGLTAAGWAERYGNAALSAKLNEVAEKQLARIRSNPEQRALR